MLTIMIMIDMIDGGGVVTTRTPPPLNFIWTVWINTSNGYSKYSRTMCMYSNDRYLFWNALDYNNNSGDDDDIEIEDVDGNSNDFGFGNDWLDVAQSTIAVTSPSCRMEVGHGGRKSPLSATP